MGAGNNPRGCLAQVIVILLMRSPWLQLRVSPLHASPSILSANVTLPSGFTVPPCRLSSTPPRSPFSHNDKEKNDALREISRKDIPTRSSTNAQDANRSRWHTNQRLIKDACAHGGSSTVLCIAYKIQSALAADQEEERLNPKGESFSWAMLAKKRNLCRGRATRAV